MPARSSSSTPDRHPASSTSATGDPEAPEPTQPNCHRSPETSHQRTSQPRDLSAAPTSSSSSSGSSPTAAPSSASSAPSRPSNATNGPKDAATPALEVLTKQAVDTSDGTTIEEVTNDYDASRSAPEPTPNLNNAPSSPSPESPGRKPLDSNRSIHSVGRHRQSSASLGAENLSPT